MTFYKVEVKISQVLFVTSFIWINKLILMIVCLDILFINYGNDAFKVIYNMKKKKARRKANLSFSLKMSGTL